MLLKKIKSLVHTARRLPAVTREIAATEARWLSFRKKRRGTGGKNNIIVSLTSYPPRFGVLPLTLKTLLMQTLTDYRLTLWIAHDDYRVLPRSVRALTAFGLEIMTCQDLRAYTKLIPAMKRYPDTVIVSADDDVCYWPTWLEELVSRHVPGRNQVLCHRMHEIRLNEDGVPRPYGEWRYNSDSLEAHPLNFATGVGGVLYPPHIFPDEAFDEAEIRSRCLTNDDIWYYWMARRNDAIVQRVPSTGVLKFWSGSQETALWRVNVGNNQNDRLVTNMVAAYGFPLSDVSTPHV